MVLAPFGPEVSVDPSGPDQESNAQKDPNKPTMASTPTEAGGTIIQNFSRDEDELDSTIQLQGPVPQSNPYQELNEFVGEIARIYQLAPRAALVRIMELGQTMLTQSYA